MAAAIQIIGDFAATNRYWPRKDMTRASALYGFEPMFISKMAARKAALGSLNDFDPNVFIKTITDAGQNLLDGLTGASKAREAQATQVALTKAASEKAIAEAGARGELFKTLAWSVPIGLAAIGGLVYLGYAAKKKG